MNITIFLDIDGTLIGLDQKPTIASLPQTIKRLQSEGVHFGLNSNRSKEDVLTTIAMFGLDGPFILENGAYAIDADGQEKVFSTENTNIKVALVDLLQDFSDENNLQAKIHLTDTTKLYTEINNERGMGVHLFINRYRKYTGSIHHRIDGESNYSFAQKIESFLSLKFSSLYPTLTATAHSHGHSVTIENINTDKSTGLKQYRQRHPEQKVFAIGDGINDVSMRQSVDELYAVSNAVYELREVADYVAKKPVTEGVQEILLHIIEKERGQQ